MNALAKCQFISAAEVSTPKPSPTRSSTPRASSDSQTTAHLGKNRTSTQEFRGSTILKVIYVDLAAVGSPHAIGITKLMMVGSLN